MNSTKPKILLVGVFHMGGSSDINQFDIDNVLSAKKQIELEEVIRKLSAFQPNKVAVEAVKETDNELNTMYHQYINNSLELNTNEIQQIGFRLSARMENERIYPIDWMGELGQRDIGEVLEWAKSNQSELYKLIMEEYLPKIMDFPSKDHMILDMLIHMNQEKRVQHDHELYMQVARIGTETDYIGIDWMRWWYQRNLTIYSNLTRLITDSDDRILLLIGAAHIYLVRQFLLESGIFEVESALDYLR